MAAPFVKPSSVALTVVTGAYNYKDAVYSPTLNYIDNAFPFLMDIRGGNTLLGNNTYAGLLEILSGGEIKLDSGSIFLSNSTSNTFNGQVFLNSTVSINSIVTNNGSIVNATGSKVEFQNNSTLQFDSGSVVSGNMLWLASSSPTLFQVISSGNGNNFTINAQTAASGDTGGNLVLNAGNTSGTGTGGDVQINSGSGGSVGGAITCGAGGIITSTELASYTLLYPLGSSPLGSTGYSLQIYPFSGALGAQSRIVRQLPLTFRTLAGGSDVAVLSNYVINNSTAMLVELVCCRKSTSGGFGSAVGRVGFWIQCDGSGNVTVEGSAAAYAGLGIDTTNFTTSTSTNTFTITALHQSVQEDWQVIVNINYN
jgi:hypothetical protein